MLTSVVPTLLKEVTKKYCLKIINQTHVKIITTKKKIVLKLLVKHV